MVVEETVVIDDLCLHEVMIAMLKFQVVTLEFFDQRGEFFILVCHSHVIHKWHMT